MEGIDIKDPVEKLNSAIREGYVGLSKWLIALSTAAVAFGVSLVKANTALIWKQELFFGLSLIVISILSGVRYVRLTIDYSLYNLEEILDTRRVEYMKYYPSYEKQSDEGKKEESSIKDINDKIAVAKKNMKKINADVAVLFNWQQWLFYIGIILIALFGVLSIK